MNTLANIRTQARSLRLSGLILSLELRLQEAVTNRLPHEQFLELLLQDEIDLRAGRKIQRSTRHADFRDTRRLADFDFSFNPDIPRARIMQLATSQWVRDARDVLLIGPPGVGKSHLAQALGVSMQSREPVRPPGLRELYGRDVPLDVWLLDPKSVTERVIRDVVSDPKTQEALFANRLYQELSTMMAGMAIAICTTGSTIGGAVRTAHCAGEIAGL